MDTNSELVALPPMDQIGFRHHTSMCLCFPLAPGADVAAAIEGVRRAVNAAAVDDPFLAGHIVVDSKTCKVYLSLPKTSQLEVGVQKQHESSELPESYIELKSQGFPVTAFEGSQLAGPANSDASGPVFHVCYTVLDGGLILGFYLHHAVADGASFQMVLERVARKTCGYTNHEYQPMHLWPGAGRLAKLCFSTSKMGRSLSKAQLHEHLDRCPEYATLQHGAIPRGVGMNPQTPKPPTLAGSNNAKIFVFKLDRLNDLCRTIHHNGELTSRPSVHVALAALTWAQVAKARLAVPSAGYGNSGIAKMIMPVNWRSKAFEGETDGFIGNGTVNTMPTMETWLLLRAANEPKDLHLIVKTINKALREVDTDFVADRIRFMAAADPRRTYMNLDSTEVGQIALNTWRYFAADLEWQIPGVDACKPDAVRRFQKASTDGGILVLPSSKDSGELELLVPLKASVLEALCRQPEWTRWVDRVVG